MDESWVGTKGGRRYDHIFENPYVSEVRKEDPSPCVLCGADDTYRIFNTLLSESNPQCLNEGRCQERSRGE